MVASIKSLPNEVLENIIAHIAPVDNLALHFSCRDFHNCIPYPQRPFSTDDLLTMERWFWYSPAGDAALPPHADEDFFTCFHCRKLRLAKHFGNTMMRGPRGKRATVKAQAAARICVDCSAAR